jgi:hypothetical protein
MPACDSYTLSEVVDKFFITRMISKKKYYAAYLSIAKDKWQELFRGTIWEVQSRWMTLKKGTPYNYIDIPEGASRVFSVSVEDRCNLIQPLFYNNQLNVVSKPATKKCGCKEECSCAGCCEAVNSMTYTTKLLFTINGVDYYEKTWIESCKNGDMIEYKETPTKQYNNITGDGGDYNDDYNNDYDTEPAPFSDYTIVTVKSQKKICKLEVLECGCPAETPENEELLTNVCGCSIGLNCSLKRKHCRQYFENVDNNYYGEVKKSECGTRLYYKPSPHWKRVSDVEYPEFLLVSFQMNGMLPDSEVLVPDYALPAMKTGIHWESIRFNTSISNVTKNEAYYQHQMECSNLVAFLNPISLIELGKIQDTKILW